MPFDASANTIYRDTQDALLVRMGCPLAKFDERGRVALDVWKRPQLRAPSKVAISLSADGLADIAKWYLRRTGPANLRDKLIVMGHPEVVNLSMRRSALAQYFPRINSTGGVSLEGVTLSSSRGDYPHLLADTLNKAVLTHYASARRSWRAWAKQGEVRDFKETERVRLEDAPGLESLAPGDSIEFASLPENPSETFAIASYARGLRFTREAMMNDDADALGQIAVILADAAGRLEDKLAYGVLTTNANTADGNAFFSAAHGNISTGAIGMTSLAAASAKISSLTNANGDVLDLQPAVMLVPSGNKYAGEALNNALADVKRHESETQIKIVSSAHLSAGSSSQWYLGTDPAQMAAVEVAFRKGADQPQVDSKVHFDTDGMLFKIRHDMHAAVVDPRLMVRSSGA